MDVFNVIAGSTTIIAFAMFLLEKLKSRQRERADRENLLVLSERLRSGLPLLRSAITNAQMMVDMGKQGETTKSEMTVAARAIRSDILGVGTQLKGMEEDLDNWSYGRQIKSSRKAEELK